MARAVPEMVAARGRAPLDRIRARLPADLAPHAPRRYERIGEVVLLKLGAELGPRRREIAAAFADVLEAKTVLADYGVQGPWREPAVEVLFGDGTETVHLEDGVRFKLDAARIMFSSGNLAERIRMWRTVRPSETVVDLFAGIGYFALPMAVHGRPARVVACEVNPTAFAYLEENVRLNRAWCVEPRLGDCRQTAPQEVADRIVMGYLDGEAYLDVAMAAAKDVAILHYHESTPVEEVPHGPWSRVENAARRADCRAELLAVHRIKSYAPRIRHVVLDVRLSRPNGPAR